MSKIEIPAAELRRILADAMPFACKDTTLPTINGVHLEAGGGNLVAVATDRYVLGASRTAYQGPKFETTLRLHHAKLLETMSRTYRRSQRNVTIAYRSGVLSCKFSTGEGVTFGIERPQPIRGKSGKFQSRPTNFPKWRQLLPESADAAETLNLFDVDPRKLARFGHVGHRMSVYVTGPMKIIAIAIGDDFIGGIMPIRLPDGDAGARWSLPGWLAEPETVTEKAS